MGQEFFACVPIQNKLFYSPANDRVEVLDVVEVVSSNTCFIYVFYYCS